jgi:hypothetical protein
LIVYVEEVAYIYTTSLGRLELYRNSEELTKLNQSLLFVTTLVTSQVFFLGYFMLSEKDWFGLQFTLINLEFKDRPRGKEFWIGLNRKQFT